MDKWFVIAGNHYQYLDFVKEKVSEGWPNNTSLSMSNFVYVDRIDKLRGISNPKGYFVGTWRDREDIKEVLIQLSVAYHNEKMHDNLIEILHEVLQN